MLLIKDAVLTFNSNTNIEKRLFSKLNLHFKEGDFVTVIGPNGSGKSSLLNIIAGTCMLESGKILLQNNNVAKDCEWMRAKYIGRVFQNPTWGFAPDMTLLENLAIMLQKHQKHIFSKGMSQKVKEKIYNEIKSLNINLEDKLLNKPNELSGGQCQSAALMLAVLSNPLIILLDEHTASLDPQSARNVLSLTESLIKEKKLTAIMVTHNINDAMKYGNRMIMMKNGHPILDVTEEEKQKISVGKVEKMFRNM